MNKQASSFCFPHCDQEGTMAHIWWRCPKVTQFWITVFIYSVTGVNLTRTPEIIHFRKLYKDLSKYTSRLITYINLAAKIANAHCWSQSIVDYIKQKCNWIMINEKTLMTRWPTFFQITKTIWWDMATLDTVFVCGWLSLEWSCPNCSQLLFPWPFSLLLFSYLLLFCADQFWESWIVLDTLYFACLFT